VAFELSDAVASTRGDLTEENSRYDGLPVIIVAPALDRAIRFSGARMLAAATDGYPDNGGWLRVIVIVVAGTIVVVIVGNIVVIARGIVVSRALVVVLVDVPVAVVVDVIVAILGSIGIDCRVVVVAVEFAGVAITVLVLTVGIFSVDDPVAIVVNVIGTHFLGAMMNFRILWFAVGGVRIAVIVEIVDRIATRASDNNERRQRGAIQDCGSVYLMKDGHLGLALPGRSYTRGRRCGSNTVPIDLRFCLRSRSSPMFLDPPRQWTH